MNPNASDIVLVNSLIEIAAKGTALQMQMKDFQYSHLFPGAPNDNFREKYVFGRRFEI